MFKYIVIASVVALLAGACSSSQGVGDASANVVEVAPVRTQALPQATVYKTNSDSRNLVPVTLSPDGKTIVSYPAPTDINASQRPVELADGYLLDRRGVNDNSAFTGYTYAQYSSMTSAPGTDELLRSINHDISIVAMVRLPMSLNDAVNDTAACNRMIREGFPGCEVIIEPTKCD